MIENPVYIIGYAHGGLTLLSNMLRRSPNFFTVSGKQGFGPDEGHNELHYYLPHYLRNPDGKGGSCWTYNVEDNHNTEESITKGHRELYNRLINNICHEKDMRFLDKSQSYIIKMRYLQELFNYTNCYFIFVARNPYVLAYKPRKFHSWYKDNKNKTDKDYISNGCSHIMNNYKIFKDDASHIKKLRIIKYEDLVLDTECILRKACDFLDVDFIDDMVPHPPNNRKWYPINKSLIWQHRLEKDRDFFATSELDNIISIECSEYIKDMEYKEWYPADKHP